MGIRIFYFSVLIVLVSWHLLPVPSRAQDTPEPSRPEWESVPRYETAEWFRDAKFGIFVHWGVYSVPAFGSEWYPREMYQRGTAAYGHHIATYGPHSVFGYKDFIPLFTAERWDPKGWARLFKEAGARYVVPVAEHHDGFAMYDCGLSPWNALSMGPKRDIIGELASAAREEGLVFGLSSHRAEHWWFMHPGTTFDSDVNDPRYAGLYGPARPDSTQPDRRYLEDWYARCSELVEKYRPQLFYFDWWIEQPAFAPYLRRFATSYYTTAREWGKEVVLNYKNAAFPDHTAVLDIERGRLSEIRDLPWQTDTSIGKRSWGYIEGEENKSADELIDVLIDIVSKNGCLLLNIGPRADGSIPEQQAEVLREMGAWLSVNGEAVYGTRPWEIFGEGITREHSGMFSEMRSRPYTAQDIRFTKKGENVYALCLDWPGDSLWIRNIEPEPGSTVRLLGYDRRLDWRLVPGEGLCIVLPGSMRSEQNRPCRYAYAFRIRGRRPPVLEPPRLFIDGQKADGTFVFPDTVRLATRALPADASIFYTLDGSEPSIRSTQYHEPVLVSGSVRVRAIAAKDGFVRSGPADLVLRKTGNIRSLNYTFPFGEKYAAGGNLSLADGERGSTDFNDGKWLGFEGTDCDVLVELKENQPVKRICVGFLQNQDAWIFLPTTVEVSLSDDGTTFRDVHSSGSAEPEPSGTVERKEYCVEIETGGARYVRVKAVSIGTCPVWHKGAGGKAWIFVDEIAVE